jgi:nucleoside-diphosphate-sugar epimerase
VVCARFAAAGYAVRVLDDLSTGRREYCEPEWELIEGDVADRVGVAAAAADCDVVAHLAAFVSVPASFERRADNDRINIDGTRAVIAACEKQGVSKLVFASSCSVYADDGVASKREDAVPAPASPYAESKLAGERLLAAAAIPNAALRFFNVFGPRQRAGSGYAAAVPNFMHAPRLRVRRRRRRGRIPGRATRRHGHPQRRNRRRDGDWPVGRDSRATRRRGRRDSVRSREAGRRTFRPGRCHAHLGRTRVGRRGKSRGRTRHYVGLVARSDGLSA